jgi:hypothetical protein
MRCGMEGRVDRPLAELAGGRGGGGLGGWLAGGGGEGETAAGVCREGVQITGHWG